MHSINIEFTAERIKTLADNNRCIICDKLNTPCVRYPCGHPVCEECVNVAECCLLCITPPTKITYFKDEPLSLRVQHVSELVLTFQDLFGVDVDRILNTSKQLKLEKLLFPECIQAPNKYHNKRKSSNSFCEGKENIKPKTVLPGEEVTNTSYVKMENKNNYVKQWLSNIESPISSKKRNRKPFADLSSNNNQQECFTKESQIKGYRKRSHFKTVTSNDTDNHNIPLKKSKTEVSIKNKGLNSIEKSNKSYQKKYEANESGIVIDDDVVEIIDSQLEVIDKDKLACMAVAEAELNKDEACSDLFIDSSYIDKTLPNVCEKPDKNTPTPKVPFYKKSFLHKICSANHIDDIRKDSTNCKNVTITVDTKSFLTTINISSFEENINCTMSKSHLNVDKSKIDNEPRDHNKHEISSNILIKENIQHNSHLSKDAKDCHKEKENKLKTVFIEDHDNEVKRKGVIINDSDSDSSLSATDKKNEVTVEVHRSCAKTDYGVLSVLDQNQTENRMRHAGREQTPLSTDSSDKENYDPNRMKRTKHDKKCSSKK